MTKRKGLYEKYTNLVLCVFIIFNSHCDKVIINSQVADLSVKERNSIELGRAQLFSSITIDGNTADWENIDPITIASDQSSVNLKIAHDDTHLFFCIEGTDMGPYYDLLINADGNSSTGYQAWMWPLSGCDYLIENNVLFQSTGSEWAWSELGAENIHSFTSSTVIEISILRTAISNFSDTISFGFWDVNTSWEPKSFLPVSGGNLPAYQLNEQQYPPPPDQMKILVPAYFYPGVEWDRLNSQALKMPGRIWTIANPHNGPGSSIDNNYVTAIDNFRANGGKVIGYVYTEYGNRTIKAVKRDINRWYRWYGVDGIFFDEMTNTSGKENYYQKLYNHVKNKKDPNALIVGNPGTSTLESYLIYNNTRVADVLCIFETENGFPSWSPPPWTQYYKNSNFYVLPFNTNISDYQPSVDHAISHNVGWIYVTDDILPNPWNQLPSYFEDFCNYIFRK